MVAAIILGGVQLDVYGETAFNKEMEAVIFKVKTMFNISNNYDTFNSSISSSGNNVYFYFNWSDSTNKMDNISISTDSKGNIISYNKYNPSFIEPESRLPKYDRNQALEIAKDLIKNVDPTNINNIKLVENNDPIRSADYEYGFNFTRLVNNIPYPDNNINITINKYTGELTNYYTNWDRDIEFPNITGVISMDAGKVAYKDKIGLKLVYKSSNRTFRDINTNEPSKYFLAYAPLNGLKVIDAFTGETLNIEYFGGNGMGEGAADEKDMAVGNTIITPEERAEIDKLVGILDVNELESKAREILSLDDTYILQGKNLFNDYKNPGDYIWSVYFNKKIDNEVLSADVSFNAKTGEIISFNKYNGYNPNDKPVITKSEALEIAKSYLQNSQPEKFNLVELVDENNKEGLTTYYFRFIRKSDDIYVESDGINIGVDTVNKEVINFNLDWFRGEFPKKGDIISLDEAYDVLFNDIGYELKYATIFDFNKPYEENKEIKLVYGVNTNKPSIIDSHTGEILDYNGMPYKTSKVVVYNDLASSYAKNKIETLAQYGVAFSSDMFMPKQKIKQKDFIYLLFKSMNSYSNHTEGEIENIYDELIRANIIKEDEKNPERIVTKEEAVKYVLRVMNYSKIAEIPNIFGDIFKDSKSIDPNLIGYMNIAYGLRIIVGDGTDNIRPKYELKREDAASIIYNYMFN